MPPVRFEPTISAGERLLQTTDTHSECVILKALPLQQWLRERASMLRYTYIASLVTLRLFIKAE